MTILTRITVELLSEIFHFTHVSDSCIQHEADIDGIQWIYQPLLLSVLNGLADAHRNRTNLESPFPTYCMTNNVVFFCPALDWLSDIRLSLVLHSPIGRVRYSAGVACMP